MIGQVALWFWLEKIVFIIFQNLVGFFSESLRTDLRFLCTPYNVCCVVLCSFEHISISVRFRLDLIVSDRIC